MVTESEACNSLGSCILHTPCKTVTKKAKSHQSAKFPEIFLPGKRSLHATTLNTTTVEIKPGSPLKRATKPLPCHDLKKQSENSPKATYTARELQKKVGLMVAPNHTALRWHKENRVRSCSLQTVPYITFSLKHHTTCPTMQRTLRGHEATAHWCELFVNKRSCSQKVRASRLLCRLTVA